MATGALSVFRCEGDVLGHAAAGFHDGIESWTLALEGGQTPSVQAFVAQHERAHHRLHSLTPWGLAMLLSGLPGPDGAPASAAWADLVSRCRSTHERYATWTSITQIDNGLEFLRGNLVYLGHYAHSRHLADLIGPSRHPDVAVEMLSLAAMAPADLMGLDLADIRASGAASSIEGPDQRLDALLERIERDDQVARKLKRTLSVQEADTSDAYWDDLCSVLGEIGVKTATAEVQRSWSRDLIAQFDRMWDQSGVVGRRRVLLEDGSAPTDQLTALVDTHQRERLRLHLEPLELRIADLSTTSLTEFARPSEAGPPFVVLSWLHSRFLRRHFSGVPAGDRLYTCLLAVDRRQSPGHASLLEIPDSPAEASALLARAVATTRLTTLRTLQATDDSVDFRGWEPTFVLIDSDVLAFLEHTSADPDGATWSVIDVGIDRHVDVVTLRRQANPGQVYLLPCSAPTGRMVGAWMNEHSAFTQDATAFEDVRDQAFDLLRILLGTLWIIDLHGWD